jgi:predicted permease
MLHESVRLATAIENAIRDVRHAFRAIGRMPGLASVVIASLGIGIGVNTAIFTRIQYMVFRPLPGVSEAGTLHLVEARAETGSYPGVSWLEYRDLRDRLRSFRGLVAARMVPFNVGEASRVERTFGQLVSGNLFAELGLRPVLGRFLLPEEADQPGGAPVAVISYDLWQSRFGASGKALEQTVRVNNRELAVVGVAPEGFQGTVLGLQFDLWVPATLAQVLLAGSRELEDRGQRGYTVMGQLRPGTTRLQAQAEVEQVMRELALDYPDSNAAMTGEVIPFWRTPRGPQRMMIAGLGVIQGVLLFLLLTVCGNTATLVLARASDRYREIAVRMAVGAGRGRVASVLLTENVVLALLAAALGAVIAVWGTEALRTVEMPGNLPFRFQTRVDGVGFAFAAGLGLLSGLLFGMAPAIHLARIDPQRVMRTGSPMATRSLIRNLLIGTEVAFALVVLVVAAMFIRSFTDTRDTDTGFRKEGLLLATYDLSGRAVDSRTFAARVQQRLNDLPGVEAAAIAVSVPLDIHGLPLRNFSLEGRARTSAGADRALSNTVTPGYFRTMGVPFKAGVDFVDLYDTEAPPQAIVNEAFVRRYLDGGEPIGRRLQNGSRTFVIVGVVGTSLSDSFGEPPTPVLYLSYRDRPAPVGEMHVRTRAGFENALAADVRRVMHEIDPSLPVYNVRTMTTHIDRNLVLRRIPAQLFAFLGPMLLVLAGIGIYAVVAHVVAHRTAEIGVRLALGASARRVVSQIIGETLRVVGVGVLAGWLVACVISVDLLGGSARDFAILAGVPAILLGTATLACWLPARRATRIDPLAALRQD